MKTLACALVIVLAMAAPAAADTLIPFTALLNGPQENPPQPSPSQGVALVLLNKESNAVCYRISYSPLAGTELFAHFHGPAAPGQNADVLHDISPAPSPLGSPKHGCVTFTRDEVKQLVNGLVYINVHSSVAPGGEIRGQLLPDKVKYKKVPALASPGGAFLD
jgi:hypothetical protein